MLAFNAYQFSWLCFRIERLQGDALFDADTDEGKQEEKEWRERVAKHLGFMQKQCERLGLDASAGQCERIATAAPYREVSPLCYLLRDLEATIVREIKRPVFLTLRPDLGEFYDDEDKWFWGEQVGRQFDRSVHDIAEARRCLALERWDACVHHLMLAVEQAIRKWAKDLKLRTKLPLDLENIEQILQAAAKKYEEIKQRKKSVKRDRDLKYVAETSGHFGFIKDAWRNHAAHGRERYDERKARNLMVHVEAFMRLLASRKTPIT